MLTMYSGRRNINYRKLLMLHQLASSEMGAFFTFSDGNGHAQDMHSFFYLRNSLTSIRMFLHTTEYFFHYIFFSGMSVTFAMTRARVGLQNTSVSAQELCIKRICSI
jgi:hypothetical protein